MAIEIRIGGVPEHFNLPIHLAIEDGDFKTENINIKWIDFAGGTGEMTKALAEDQCDICIVLTEGIISAIINDNPSKIVSGYVKTPLIWGVHTGAESTLKNYNEIFNSKIAISRIGSGSHLMPTVDALIKGKSIEEDQFVVVKNIDNAIESLNEGKSDVFYWEKYTTKPYVQQKLLNRIGEFTSPWPCFVIAASNNLILSNPAELDKILRIIHKKCEEFMQREDAIELVSKRYNINPEDAGYWYHATEWEVDSWVSDKMLNSVLFTLKKANLLPEHANTSNLVWRR